MNIGYHIVVVAFAGLLLSALLVLRARQLRSTALRLAKLLRASAH